MNNVKSHLIEHKRKYLMALAMIAWFILIVIIATNKPKVSSAGYESYNNIAIMIGSFTIAWYAVFILTGIIFAAIVAMEEADLLGIKRDHIYDGLLYAVPLSIIGARLYYVLFDPKGGYTSIGDVFNIRDGGLAIHGAVIVTIVFLIVFTKVKKISIWKFLDLLAPGFLIGQIIGRWGNFFNQEANGIATTRTFLRQTLKLPRFIVDNMYFYDSNVGALNYYHPTFLYEGVWNSIGLLLMLILRRTKGLKSGDLIGIYLIWYGFGRAVIEQYLRTDPLMLGNTDIRINVLNSIVLFVGGGFAYLIAKRMLFKSLPDYVDTLNFGLRK
ncbi:MAG: prolipoprotein diacylglyceryl transferase [Acholeplasma sp.]|nr:prolipoprotein diacylglyceryl transferase [Acholeplasma sp.]